MRNLTVLLAALALLLASCTAREAAPSEAQPEILIGFSMDTLEEERWQRDRDLFVARARELGADVIVQAASGDSFLQMSQAQNMIARGVDVLVVVAHDAAAMRPIVSEARAAGVKVVAYDRLIYLVDLDFYLAFDHEWSGALQAQYLVQQAPEGRYVVLGGSPADDQAYEALRGVHRVLDPLRKRGDIEIVLEQMVPDWSPDVAAALIDELLTADAEVAQDAGAAGAAASDSMGTSDAPDSPDAPAPPRIDAVIAADDTIAGGVVAALSHHGLAGQVLVAGQNADLEAMQRILAGTQTMTVYKPIRELAATAAEVAVALARGEQPAATGTTFNGKHQVPTLVLEPVAVDRMNWLDTVVADGFHRKEDILGIPH